MNEGLITGGCLCGALRYEGRGLPYHVTHCHCVNCRRSSGAAFVTWATFRREAFTWVKGVPCKVEWAGRERTFCPACGTSLAFQTGPEALEVDVTVASFDDPAQVTPADHIWVEDRLPWIRLDDGLPAHPQDRPTVRAD